MGATDSILAGAGLTPEKADERALDARLSDFAARLDALERRPTIQLSAGAPAGAQRPGTPVVDTAVPRLGIYLPSGGRFWWTTLS